MKILVSGGWSYGNIGDEVIAASTIYLINKYWPSAEVIYTSYDPTSFEKYHNLSSLVSLHKRLDMTDIDFKTAIEEKDYHSLQKFVPEDYFDLCRDIDLFIMSGGGYFVESWSSQFVSRILEIAVAHANHCKVALIGQSIGPIYSNGGKTIFDEAIKNCDFVGVRDQSSFDLIKSINSRINIYLGADLANIISTVYHFNTNINLSNSVGLMLSGFSIYSSASDHKGQNELWRKIYPRITLKYYIYQYKLRKLLQYIINNTNYSISIVQSTTWSWDDRAISRFTRGLGKNRIIILRDLELSEFCKAIATSRIMISSKMHPLIIANSYGVPTVAISYNFKVDDFMTQIDRSQYCFRNDKIDIIKIISAINSRKTFKDGQIDEMKSKVEKSLMKLKESTE